jgi:hypothetical protein
MRRSILLACTVTAACGGPPAAAPAVDTRPAPASALSAKPATAADPAAGAAASAADVQEDPEEAHDPATLVPLFPKAKRPPFPRATIGEHECWQSVSLSGVARKDYDALVANCGAPTGSIEYVKPNVGRLHHKRDKRDTFVVHVQAGLCYRFFGVGDASIQDLDILIERAGGALVGEDRSHGPVAIIESDKAWCMDHDGDYQFGVQVDSPSAGAYVFGVWARPNK